MKLRDQLPTNARMAAALLDVLGTSGDIAGRARALRRAGGDGGALRLPSSWIDPAVLEGMFQCVPVDDATARRVGLSLVTPSGIGFALCYSGIATIEKAYRRVDQLLAREVRDSAYEARDMDEGRATVHFHTAASKSPPVFCRVREGMLEGLPLVFGLLPGQVRETRCVHSGAAHCVFDVRWTRSSRSGMAWGGIAGLVVGIAAGLLATLGIGLSWPSVAFVTLILGAFIGLFGLTAGHSVDLGRQLEAVAGARRGQLALLEQADRALAERMDELAKLDADVHARAEGQGEPRTRVHGAAVVAARESDASDSDGSELAAAVGQTSERVRADAVALQREIGELHRRLVGREGWTPEELEASLGRCGEQAQRIQAAAGELARRAGPRIGHREACDFAALVAGAADAMRSSLAGGQLLQVDLEPDLPRVECQPFQLEQVVTQLLKNALEATEGTGRIAVRLRGLPHGLELEIEDDGRGMEQSEIEEVFDPFLASPVAGIDTSGIGLPVCYRIVDAHGGELRIKSEPGQGTQVSVLLPVS